jgi:hypothetical protein
MVGLFAAVLMIVVSGALIVLRVPAPIAAGAGIAAAVFPLLRTIMVGPVLGVGRTHNPIMAIRASLALTRGNTGRILAFLALAMLVYVVASSVVMMVVGLLSAQAAGRRKRKRPPAQRSAPRCSMPWARPISWRCWRASTGS